MSNESKLSKTDIDVLVHVRDNAGALPTPTGKGANIAKGRIEASRVKLLNSGHLSPATKNRVIISNYGISTLSLLEKAAKAETTDTKKESIGSPISLERTVYPSTEQSIAVFPDADYGGAHKYLIRNSSGFANGQTQYEDSNHTIQFLQKNEDGSMTPGILSEQLVIALLDRHKKLNARFPSPQNDQMIDCLEGFLDACKQRVDDRIARNVMGDLKK